MKKIILSFLFGFSATASPLLHAEDLLAVYHAALDNDPQFQAARAAFQAVVEDRNQQIANYLPTLSLSASLDQNNDQSTSQYQYQSESYALTLTQSLYNHQNTAALNQAGAKVAQAEAKFAYARQDLIYRVAKQYFAVLAAENNLQLAIAERKASHEQLQQTRQRFDVGLISITDVHEAQARYDQAEAGEILARNQLAVSQQTLWEITNQQHEHLNKTGQFNILSAKLPLLQPEPLDIDAWVNTAKQQNLLLLASRHAVAIARQEVSLQQAGHFPTLDLVASHSYSHTGSGAANGAQSNRNNKLSLQLNLPLYQGGKVNSLTRSARYRLQQTEQQHEQQRRATERQIRNAYLGVIANISQVKALKQALASSQIALEATQAGFEVGTRTAINVLDSQRALFRARRNFIQARYDYVLETLKLKLAAGILSVKDLEYINRWLTP